MRLSSNTSDGFGILFAADFDDEEAPILDGEVAPTLAFEHHQPVPEAPEQIEARFSSADLTDARRTGHEAGYAEGFAAASESASANRDALLALLAERLSSSRLDCEALAARQLDAITGASLAMVSACLPVLCEQAGTQDLMAVLAYMLPSVVGQPELIITVHPSQVEAVEREIAPVLGKNTPYEVQTAPSMGRSDVSVTWKSGSAKRDTRALRREVASMLRRSLRAPTGLLTNEEHRHGR